MEASRAVPSPRPRASLRPTPLRSKRKADPAFEQLYRRHARAIYQYALALTANPSDAEDVTQTTFLNAYRAYQRGERPHKPHNWLITIAHNVCRMRWRQAGSRPREVALEEAPEPAAHDHEQPDLDEVLTALARLSFNQRAALVMRELEGRSYQEIASVLDLSVSAVEALLFRARRRLKLERTALGAITSVPLPGSLSSFLGAGGGGAVAAGGAAIGADVVLKAAAIVAAGAVTAGVGYKSVGVVAASPAARSPAQTQAQATPNAKAPLAAPGTPARRALATRKPTKRHERLRSATPGAVRGQPTTTPTAQATAAPQAASPTASPTAPAAPVTSVAPATVPLPQLPPVPPAPPPAPPPPPPPVTVPQLPLPPPPPLPITVTTPTLPPPPIK